MGPRENLRSSTEMNSACGKVLVTPKRLKRTPQCVPSAMGPKGILNSDSSVREDECLNLTSSQNRTLKTEQSNQSMKSKQQRETKEIVELFDSEKGKTIILLNLKPA